MTKPSKKKPAPLAEIIPAPGIDARILTIRGKQVILDAELAELYGVETRTLNQAVKRNKERFPAAFMFQLTEEEGVILISQFVISSSETGSRSGWGGRRKLPFAFTEHGVLMLANVLKSDSAIAVSIRIIESFVTLRTAMLAAPDLAKKIEAIEDRLSGFQEQLDAFQEIILPLLTVSQMGKRKIGFKSGED